MDDHLDRAHIAALTDLTIDAMRLLSMSASNKAAGARARGDDLAAARYDKLATEFEHRPGRHLTFALVLDLVPDLDGSPGAVGLQIGQA